MCAGGCLNGRDSVIVLSILVLLKACRRTNNV